MRRRLQTSWESFSDRGRVEIADIEFQNGQKSVRLSVEGGVAGIRQRRVFLDQGFKYDGSLWAKREQGSPQLMLRVRSSRGGPVASIPLVLTNADWHEIPFSFTSSVRDTHAAVEIVATDGTVLVDFISMMRADVRRDGITHADIIAMNRSLNPLD